MQAFKDLLLDLILSALTSFDTMVDNAAAALSGSGGMINVPAVWREVLAFSNLLKPFCYFIIGICLFIELAQVAQKVDIIKYEHGIKICIKMVFAKLCIDIAPKFLEACYGQASLWITSALNVGGYTNLGSMMSREITTQFNAVSGLWQVLGLFLSVMLVALAIKVCGLLIQVIAFGRMFELFVYLAVSPLPCAFFPLGDGTGGGFSRITMKFFKSFIAVCLQGVMIIVSIRIFYMIIGTAFQSMIAQATQAGSASGVITELCFTMLLGAIVLVMSVSKCGTWARQIIDAM